MPAKGVDWNKQVAVEIIKAGYFALAKKNHPDHGGSHDKFLVLGATKEHLEGLLNGTARQESSRHEAPPKRPYRHRAPEYPEDDAPPGMVKYAVGWWMIPNVTVERESEKAIQVWINHSTYVLFWLPKSQLHRNANQVWEVGDSGQLVFSEWIAKQKGWV